MYLQRKDGIIMNELKIIKTFKEIIEYFPIEIKDVMSKIPKEIIFMAQEIRLRVNKPIMINCSQNIYFVTKLGMVTSCMDANLVDINQQEILEIFKKMCDYSIYSYQSEIKNGFITIKGGHRVGICGTAVLSNEDIVGIRDISSMNIRIAKQVYIENSDFISAIGDGNEGTLLVGPPACGKTTLLREIARTLSNGSLGYMKKVVIVDERGELSSMYLGVAQNDLGFCDVLNLYPKGDGIIQAIRSLSPEVIICDEIGNKEDVLALKSGLNAGVCVISSIHAGSINEFVKRKSAQRLVDTGAFKNIDMMKDKSNPGSVEKIYKEEEINDKINRFNNVDLIRDNSRLYGIA